MPYRALLGILPFAGAFGGALDGTTEKSQSSAGGQRPSERPPLERKGATKLRKCSPNVVKRPIS